jgi:Protein of unknown function, DUF488
MANASFRGNADYMQTPEFEKSLRGVMQLANRDRIALMRAEAVPWRCHRLLYCTAIKCGPRQHRLSRRSISSLHEVQARVPHVRAGRGPLNLDATVS